MPILNDHFDYTISEHYLTAIINDDYSGLSDNEANRVNRFLSAANNLPDATWSIPDDQEPHFAPCEIDGIFSNCLDVKLYFTNPKINE